MKNNQGPKPRSLRPRLAPIVATVTISAQSSADNSDQVAIGSKIAVIDPDQAKTASTAPSLGRTERAHRYAGTYHERRIQRIGKQSRERSMSNRAGPRRHAVDHRSGHGPVQELNPRIER